jgi:Domain of unknown function (DUF4402)
MSGLRLALPLVAATLACGLVMPAVAIAQDTGTASVPCRLCEPSAPQVLNARPEAPLRLEVESRLDFDKVVVEGNGSALLALSPNGTAIVSGAASAAGARVMPGTVVVHGEPGRPIRVDLPGRVLLFGNGRGTIQLDRLVTDLPAFPRIGDDGTLSFRFGGDLRLTGDNDGAYHGTIDITVEYL